MPGTVQVSVLCLMDLPSSPSSPLSLHLAIGKMEYQTRDTGDFSFRLISLRENLIITLRDAEGSEISRTDVQTKAVVVKGIWDDVFLLNGGGRVHLRLQFILSEDERRRIRDMRESAMKKKQKNLVQRNVTHSESGSVSETEESLEFPVLKRIQTGKRSFSSPDLRKEAIRDLPDATDGGKSATSAQLSEKLPVHLPESTAMKSKELFKSQQGASDYLNPPPAEDTNAPSLSMTTAKSRHPGSEVESCTTVSPSSVKNIVSAFESSRPRGVKHPNSPSALNLNMREGGSVKNYGMANAASRKDKAGTDGKFLSIESFNRGAKLQQISDGLKSSAIVEQDKAQVSHIARESEIKQGGERVVGLESKRTLTEKKVSSEGVILNTMIRQPEVACEISDGVLPENSLLKERDLRKLRSPGQDHAIQASRDAESLRGRLFLPLQGTSPSPAHIEEKSNKEVAFSTNGVKVKTTEERRDSSSVLDASTSYIVDVIGHERTDENYLCFQSPSENQRLVRQDRVSSLLLEHCNSLLIQDEIRYFCMTTVSKRVRKYVDGSFLNPVGETMEGRLLALEEKHGQNTDRSKSGTDLSNLIDPKVETPKHSSIDIGRLVEQALNVALIVVCGTLLLGTAQRKTR